MIICRPREACPRDGGERGPSTPQHCWDYWVARSSRAMTPESWRYSEPVLLTGICSSDGRSRMQAVPESPRAYSPPACRDTHENLGFSAMLRGREPVRGRKAIVDAK